MNGGLPAVSTFSSAPTAAYGGVSSHTPPVSGADGLMGTGPLHPASDGAPPSLKPGWVQEPGPRHSRPSSPGPAPHMSSGSLGHICDVWKWPFEEWLPSLHLGKLRLQGKWLTRVLLPTCLSLEPLWRQGAGFQAVNQNQGLPSAGWGRPCSAAKHTGAPGCGGCPFPEVGLHLSPPPRLPRDNCRQLWGRPWEGIGLGEAWDTVGQGWLGWGAPEAGP